MRYTFVQGETKPNSHLTPEYLSKYGNGETFVETGTYMGDTVLLAIESGFKNIHSIELNGTLYEQAVKKFSENKNVKLWQGDSIDCLEEIVSSLDSPATFWLDAHASGPMPGGKSGGSPVIDELNIIMKSSIKEHTIFIDDRRLFGSSEWSYVKELDAMDLIKKINPNYKIHLLDGHIENDVICATIR